jgi:hypothetical protein
MRIACCAIELPAVERHPNRLPFLGVLAYVDQLSEKGAVGSRHHRILLRRQAAIEALPSLIGMGVNCRWDLESHDKQRNVGVLTQAYLLGSRLVVKGILYSLDWPTEIDAMRTKELGMSFDAHNCHIANLRAEFYEITRLHFTGAAILLRNKAAYRKSRLWIGH